MFDQYFTLCKGMGMGSTEWDPESKIVLYSLTWGDSTGLRTASYYNTFIYLSLIRSLHFPTNLKTFVNEILVIRFLPFTDCFFRSGVVSFRFHAPRDSLPRRRFQGSSYFVPPHRRNTNSPKIACVGGYPKDSPESRATFVSHKKEEAHVNNKVQ